MKFPKLLKSATALAFLSALAASAGLAPAHAEDKINIIMDGGPLWDPFFGAMKKGGEDAAKDLGADFQWVTSTDTANFDTDYAKLVKQSASRHPSALIIGNYFPARARPDHQGHHRCGRASLHFPRRRRFVERGRRDRLYRLQLLRARKTGR